MFNGICALLLLSGVARNGRSLVDGIASATQALAEVSAAAGELAGAGANATVSLTQLGVKVMSTSATAMGDLWHGVDLHNVSIKRQTCRVGGVSVKHLAAWLLSTDPFHDDAAEWFSVQAGSVSHAVPAIVMGDETTDVNGSYRKTWINCRRRSDNSAACALVSWTVTYDVQWVNPAWEAFGFTAESQGEFILQQLRSCLGKLRPLADAELAIDDYALAKSLHMPLGWNIWARAAWWALAILAVICLSLFTRGIYMLGTLVFNFVCQFLWVQLLHTATWSYTRAPQFHQFIVGIVKSQLKQESTEDQKAEDFWITIDDDAFYEVTGH